MQKTSRPCAPRHRRTLAVTLLTAMLAAASSAYAANDLWIGNSDANFNTLTNWTSSANPNGNTPEFGVAGTSGTTLTNDQTGSSYAGLLFDSGASAYTIGGNAFTLTGNITNNSTSTQTINTDITSTAARTVTATSGQLVFGGNITNDNSLTLVATNKITLAGTNSLATTASGSFVGFNINAGAGGVDITGSTTVGAGLSGATNNGGVTFAGTTTVTLQSGGSLTINGSGTTASTTPNSIIGHNAAGTTTLLVNGGTLTVGANSGFILGNNLNTATGVLTIASGTATINRGTAETTTTLTDARMIMMGKDKATGIINLNGGTLATDRQFVRDGSTATGTGTGTGIANFVFGGGTLKALGNQTDWLQSTTASIGGQGGSSVNNAALALSSVTTTSANSTIDSNGFSVAINSAISGAGGFHITDSSATTGIVHFGGASYAYTGATSVDSGTFNTNAASVAFSGNIAVAGGKLTLNGSGTGSVSTTGFSMSSGTWTVSIGDTVSTSGNMSITGGTLDASAFSGSEATYSSTGYTLFTSISGTGSVSGLSITGYDTSTYLASLSNAGVLTFSAIPEPSTYAAIFGALALVGAVVQRRRRNRQA